MQTLYEILERVDCSHHWIIRPGSKPQHIEEPLTAELVGKHGYGRGACPIRRGESSTRLALLDLDSHKGESTWDEMADAAGRVASELERRGLRPVPFRSTGGNGIHLYVLWKTQQDAYSVRSLLRDALAACGFQNGTGGVAAGQIEIFPKQYSVPAKGCGSMFVLPGFKKSCPLDPIAFEPMPVTSLRWLTSADVPALERPERSTTTAAAAPCMDEVKLRELLADHDPACQYDAWNKRLAIIHHESGGEQWGLNLAVEWSESAWKGDRSQYHSCADEVTAKWSTYGSAPNPATAASLRVEKPADVDDFDVIEPKPEKPRIKLEPGRLHIYAVQAEEHLSAELYERNHKLVRIGGAVELPGDTLEVERNAAQPVILEAGTEFVIRRLGELARIEVYRKRENKWAATDCPKALAVNIVEQKSWKSMRLLNAIASAPFIRPDLTVCTAPGYDAQTGVFYAPNAAFPDVPESPTQRQAAEALAVLLASYDEFPFASEASRAAFASNILTEAVRIAIDNAPVFTYTAPEAGTGKTLLAEMPARIVHGREPAKRAWADGDELRKVLFSSLLVGDRSILFDNAQQGVKVRAPILCGFVTAPIYSDRKLGFSETPEVPNRAVVSMTGNNITPTGDLARRSIVIRQDADASSGELRARRFRIRDLKAYVGARRGELLTAALIVVRAFVAAGRPEQAVPLASFEQWSRLARDPLMWLGMADPVETQADETNDEAAPLGGAFGLLAKALPAEFTASELVEICNSVADDGSLRKALESAGCADGESPQKVGYWLRDNRDRTAAGWKLVGRRISSGRKWRFSQKVTSLCSGRDLV